MKDLCLYDKSGIAHLRGRVIDYTQGCGVNTISISNNDDITSSKKNYVGNVNPDGTRTGYTATLSADK